MRRRADSAGAAGFVTSGVRRTLRVRERAEHGATRAACIPPRMTRIAHISDLHLVERAHATRRGLSDVRLRYLSFGRPIDFAARVARAREALRLALAARPDHLCITGDLTEDGTPAQFAVLAEVLHDAGVSPERTTLVPGNHDGYDDPRAFEMALAGPLAPFRETSTPGSVVVHDGAAVVAVSTLIPQSFARSAGAVDRAQLTHLALLAEDAWLRTRALVVAQHHPPMRHLAPGLQWLDGLERPEPLRGLVERHAHMHVLHGHTHAAADRAVGRGRDAQVFCVPAAVDTDEPVRVYEATEQRLRPLCGPAARPVQSRERRRPTLPSLAASA